MSVNVSCDSKIQVSDCVFATAFFRLVLSCRDASCGFRDSDLSSISANDYRPASSAISAAAEWVAAVFAQVAQHVLNLSLFGRSPETADVSTLLLNPLPEVLVILTTRSDRLKWNSATGQRDRRFVPDFSTIPIRTSNLFRQGRYL